MRSGDGDDHACVPDLHLSDPMVDRHLAQGMALLERLSELLHDLLRHPLVRLVFEVEHVPVARAPAGGADEGGNPSGLVVSHLRDGALERERLVGEPEAPARDRWDDGDLVALGERLAALGIRAIACEEKTRRLPVEGERRPHIAHDCAVRKLNLELSGSGAFPQPGEESDANLHAQRVTTGCLVAPDMLGRAAMAVATRESSLGEHVYRELRTRVLTRRHAPGEKLSLHNLADELGVSRSPVHQALTRLVTEGLLTVKARHGYFVTPVTAPALSEGYDVRLALELHAAERTVGAIPDASLRRFRSLLEATAASLSHEQWDTTNAAFHEFQIDLAANALLSRFYRELSVNLLMQVIRSGRLEGHQNLVTEHEHIVEAFERDDREGARRAIAEHIETGRRIALDAIERAGGVL